jgi:hypothetical protein
MPGDGRTRVLATARAVVRYLVARPEAKDTLAGIALWWLEHERAERLLHEVEQAVDFLVAEGLLLETRRHGTPPYYRLNTGRRDSITRLLRT